MENVSGSGGTATISRARVHEGGSDEQSVADELAARGWTDGLPVVVPTPSRVAELLEWAGAPADLLVGVEPVRSRAITAEKVAVNAVMAGCRGPHFPVVLAAIDAMCRPEFLLHGVTSSTGGSSALVIVNGPIRRELGLTAEFSLLGGEPAALVIGRAVRLVLRNLLDVRPGSIDRSTLGHPGKIGWCLGEDEENSPWPSLAADRGVPDDTSSVTVFGAMAPRQTMNEWTTDPEELLETVAAEMRHNMLTYSIWGGNYVVVLPPQLRRWLDDAGWTKNDIRSFVHERARVRRGDWERVGKAAVVDESNRDREYRALPEPEDLLIVAGGGPAGGFSAVIPPWLGTKSRAVTVAVGACLDC